MESSEKFSPGRPTLFRFLFILFLVAIPLITWWNAAFGSLYVLTVIFLGIGFSNKSKVLLFFSCSFVVAIRTLVEGEYENLTAVLIRLIIYLIVTFLAADVTQQYHEIKRSKTELTLALANTLDSRDPYTAGHSENVANYALMIAKEMDLSKKQCDAIYIGGLLHDIGKIGLPEAILTKPTRLTADEFEFIKLHPTIGYEMIKHISSYNQNGILDMVLYHHERFDGKGYPQGLKGKEIPIVARIMSIADSFDAMTSKRVYNDVMEFEKVILEIEQNMGTQYDPEIAEVFISILKREGQSIVRTG